MKNVIIINGTGGSGKDTFVSFCSQIVKVLNISTVDKVKEAAKILVNWQGEKTEAARKMLSDLKKISIEYNDAPTNYIYSKFEEFNKSDDEIMFVHIREIDEIKKAKELLKAKTLLIINNNVLDILTNDSDKNVKEYDYDYIIDNSYTLEDLRQQAENFVKII